MHAGEDFKYTERLFFGSWAGAAACSAGTALMGGFFPLAARVPFLRRMLPAPTEGPSKEVRESGCFHVANFAQGSLADGQPSPVVASHLKVRLGITWSTKPIE